MPAIVKRTLTLPTDLTQWAQEQGLSLSELLRNAVQQAKANMTQVDTWGQHLAHELEKQFNISHDALMAWWWQVSQE
jgi:hypothetical protein